MHGKYATSMGIGTVPGYVKICGPFWLVFHGRHATKHQGHYMKIFTHTSRDIPDQID